MRWQRQSSVGARRTEGVLRLPAAEFAEFGLSEKNTVPEKVLKQQLMDIHRASRDIRAIQPMACND